jgi:hypothetical protein
MTCKDYTLIAGAIARWYADRNAEPIEIYLANALSADNPRFDIDKFLKACVASSEVASDV